MLIWVAALLLALGAGVAYLLSTATITIPKPSGPHEVGFTSMTVSDLERTVTLDIWYPASSTEGHRAAPYNEAALRVALAQYQGIPASLNRETPSFAFQDAPILAGRHPVVIFNHGYGSFSKQNASTAQELASHGYMVLSLAHPGDSLIAQNTQGQSIEFDGQEGVYQQLRASQNSPAFASGLATHLAAQRRASTPEAHLAATQALTHSLPYSLLGPLRQRWLGDTRLVIARLSQATLSQDGGDILSAADASRVSVMGHSFGGVTALDIARDPLPGVQRIINLDGPWLEAIGGEGGNSSELKVPVLALLSTQNIQRRQDLGLHGTFDAALRQGRQGSHAIEVAGTAHMNFTDLNFIPVLKRFSPLLGRVDNRRMARLMNQAILEFLSRGPVSGEAPLLPADHDVRQQFFPPTDCSCYPHSMPTPLKPTVSVDATLGLLDIRLGRVLKAELEPSAPKSAYRLTIDFGPYGTRTSMGRFTQHPPEELIGKQVMGVLNLGPRQVGDVQSEVLVVGIQFKGAESGEATFLTPAVDGKLGSKLF